MNDPFIGRLARQSWPEANILPLIIKNHHLRIWATHPLRRCTRQARFTRPRVCHLPGSVVGLRAPYVPLVPPPVSSAPHKFQRFLSQPFHVAEVFTGFPGVFVDLEDTIKGFQGLVEGEYDDLPEAAFYMVGAIEEAVEKAKQMAAEAA